VNAPARADEAAERPIRILVIDDEEAARRNLCSGLEDLGYETHMAPDGCAGLEQFNRATPDLVLVDLFMPVMTGLELITALKEKSPLTPVIVVSGSGTLYDAIKAIRLGAWDYVVKPIENSDEFDLVLRRNLDRAQLLVENQRQKKQLQELLATNTNKLRESEERFRKLFEESPVGIALLDSHRAIVLTNQRYRDFLGYSEAEIRQRGPAGLLHPEDWEPSLALSGRLRAGEIPLFHMEQRYVRKDGTVVWADTSITALREPDGRITHTIGWVQDITERKRAEAELAELHRRQERILTAVGEGLHGIDREGTIIFENPAAAAMLGWGVQELIGQAAHQIMHHTRPDGSPYPPEACHIYATLRDGLVRHVEDEVFWRKDGTSFPVTYTCTPMRDEAGTIIGAVVAFSDITERKRAEESHARLAARERELEADLRQSQKLEAVGQLAGGVAHDFNNILSALIMQVELLEAIPAMPAAAADGLRQIRADANRAAQLTRQLLLFSRRQVMRLEVLNLNELIINLGKLLQRLIREDVQLQLRTRPGALLTRADPGMLEQVLINLAVNARDAMPAGGKLTIETTELHVDEAVARAHPEATPGRYVGFSVSDTGDGIPPEVLPRIFEPFFTTKAAGQGTGLGLATVFGIIKQHQGWIQLENRPGRGATFQVFLPASTAAAAETAPAEAQTKPRGGTETIFLVEDDAAVRKPARKLLERMGYEVLEAADGVEALKCWEANRGRVALLLTDLVMPGGISGQELGRRLQAEQPRLKVVYTSGYSAEIAGRDFKLREGEAFVQKPFSPTVLWETIRRSLDG
jgi:PAS domain S-box-containing protein